MLLILLLTQRRNRLAPSAIRIFEFFRIFEFLNFLNFEFFVFVVFFAFYEAPFLTHVDARKGTFIHPVLLPLSSQSPSYCGTKCLTSSALHRGVGVWCLLSATGGEGDAILWSGTCIAIINCSIIWLPS